MLEIHTIPAFSDNYFWLIQASGTQSAWVVDPGDAAPVEQALTSLGLQLGGIVVTHHHFDHTGGVSQLAARYGVEVLGPDSAQIPQVTCRLQDGDSVTIADCEFKVIAVPGHTLDHIAYHASSEHLLFCGDTLFAGGCGRMFEGTATQMQGSLARLAALPAATRVYCAHEYTLANLAFARAVEPDNEALAEREHQAITLRQTGIATVPSTIAEELATNPFLRWEEPAVMAAASKRHGAQLRAPAEVFAEIRQWKDVF